MTPRAWFPLSIVLIVVAGCGGDSLVDAQGVATHKTLFNELSDTVNEAYAAVSESTTVDVEEMQSLLGQIRPAVENLRNRVQDNADAQSIIKDMSATLEDLSKSLNTGKPDLAKFKAGIESLKGNIDSLRAKI